MNFFKENARGAVYGVIMFMLGALYNSYFPQGVIAHWCSK